MANICRASRPIAFRVLYVLGMAYANACVLYLLSVDRRRKAVHVRPWYVQSGSGGSAAKPRSRPLNNSEFREVAPISWPQLRGYRYRILACTGNKYTPYKVNDRARAHTRSIAVHRYLLQLYEVSGSYELTVIQHC